VRYQTEAVLDTLNDLWLKATPELTRATNGKQPLAMIVLVAWADGEVGVVHTPKAFPVPQSMLLVDRMAKQLGTLIATVRTNMRNAMAKKVE
jgi:hypothetical protein